MRKRKKGRKLSRERDQRKALLRSLARSLILKERIKTTHAKAKELQPFIEKMVTKAKKGGLPVLRALSRNFNNEVKIAKKLIEQIAPKYKERAGGYTRIIKLGPRKEDSAKMAIIEFV
jgi:large subunit ribosomal protein L17